MLVNEPHLALQAALRAKATGKDVDTAFTTAELRRNKDDASVLLNPNSLSMSSRLRYHLRLLYSSTSRVAPRQIPLGMRFERLPPTCLRISGEGVLSHEVNAFSKPEAATALAQVLQKTVDDLPSITSS